MDEWWPTVSELDNAEQADAYDRWLRAKVAASLADQRPTVAHDEVMAEARAIIAGGEEQPRRGRSLVSLTQPKRSPRYR